MVSNLFRAAEQKLPGLVYLVFIVEDGGAAMKSKAENLNVSVLTSSLPFHKHKHHYRVRRVFYLLSGV